MDLVSQVEGSGGPSVQPEKRRRGRPRRDPTLLKPQAEATAAAHRPPAADTSVGNECMVGQAVSGVVEAVFESGYMLNVKIGNLNTNLRGVVFKPGHYVPITAENDVAPNVQMIKRNDVHFSSVQNQENASVPSKRKYAPRKAAPQSCDTNVHVVEPLSMRPPAQHLPVGPQSLSTHQVIIRSEHDDDGEDDDDDDDEESGQEEDNSNAMTSTQGASQIEDDKEALKSSTEDSGIVASKQEIGNTNEPFSTESSSQAASVTKPLCDYGTGRMTELLQALQENVKETSPLQIAAQPNSSTKVEFHQMTTTETDPKNEASVP